MNVNEVRNSTKWSKFRQSLILISFAPQTPWGAAAPPPPPPAAPALQLGVEGACECSLTYRCALLDQSGQRWIRRLSAERFGYVETLPPGYKPSSCYPPGSCTANRQNIITGPSVGDNQPFNVRREFSLQTAKIGNWKKSCKFLKKEEHFLFILDSIQKNPEKFQFGFHEVISLFHFNVFLIDFSSRGSGLDFPAVETILAQCWR